MAFDWNQVGKRYKNYEITKYLPIDEIQSTLIELIHIPTLTPIMHLHNDDTENLFCIGFQTLPTNSKGTAHILEHVALCGSKKYPIKDPFFSMTRRSLNTFMNAFTGSDFTLYPASSILEKDFYNLFEVYLDAVFFPELKELSFLQEGHRLEFVDNDPKNPLVYKGIVFNEMKGALTSVDHRLWSEIFKYITPDLPYSYNSGGDPEKIPELTYEELKEFHKTYYHPSSSLIYFYGNIPLEKHLDFLEKKALAKFHKREPLPLIPLQERFRSPIFVKKAYPAMDSSENKAIITFAFLTTTVREIEEVLALSILDSILMDTDASLLKKPLIDSGLCTEVNSFLEVDMSEIPWVWVFKGCHEKNKEKISEIFHNTLEKIVKEKPSDELIDAALHQLEFARTEITGNRNPYGLTLFFRSGLIKLHGCEPESSLMIHTLFKNLALKLKSPSYIPNLIKKHLLNNHHRVDLIMVPDETLQKKEEEKEEKVLQEIKKRLTTEQIHKILSQTDELKKYQEDLENQDIECLPKVEISDIPKEHKEYLLEIKDRGNFTTYFHDCFTNQIVYLDLVFNLPKLKFEDLEYLSLFTSLLTEMGTKEKSYEEQLEFIQAYTGGISAFLSIDIPINHPKTVNPSLTIRSKALYRNTDKVFDLLKEVSSFPDFSNKQRIKQLLLQQYTLIEQSLSSNAMNYAKSLSLKNLSLSGFINEKWYGLSYYYLLKSIVENIDQNLDSLIEKLNHLKNNVLCLKNPDFIIGCDHAHFKKMEKNNFYNLGSIFTKEHSKWTSNIKIEPETSSLYQIASPVSFTSQAYPSVTYIHPDSPALLISTDLIENTYLHETVREKGGAYGSGADYHSSTGCYTFYSYRDPHLAITLNAFEKGIERIANGKFTEQDLVEAKLGVFQSIDSPLPPKSRAPFAYHLLKTGKTKKIRQEYREKLLTISKQEIQQALKDHLLTQKNHEIFVTFAGKELLEKETKKLKTQLPIKTIATL